ncbi:MAG: division/cell wall cluster transcriptional repressor MraZ [Clostridiales Family XIII bacterium]|jgi:MraZ protein|nr:division/cell wall cluster transcriptional repressor MraZ [Clostridiales Family XIII bacterium]
MLTGNFFNTIDSKGRAFIPTKLRGGLGDRIWLVKGIEPCLYVFTPDGWETYTAKYISNRTQRDSKARKLRRMFFGNSRETDVDKQGRINLPPDHIEYAGIEREIVFVGCGDMIELWSKERFDEEMAPGNLNPDELMNEAKETSDRE